MKFLDTPLHPSADVRDWQQVSNALPQVLGHPPYSSFPSSVPAGNKRLLITASAACQLLPSDVCSAAPAPTPTAAACWSTGGFLLPFEQPLWLLEHETPPQHFHVLEKVVSLPFWFWGGFNPRRAVLCRLRFPLLYQKELTSCPVLLTKHCRKPCAYFTTVRGVKERQNPAGCKLCLWCLPIAGKSQCELTDVSHCLSHQQSHKHEHMVAAPVCTLAPPWGNPSSMACRQDLCKESPEGLGGQGVLLLLGQPALQHRCSPWELEGGRLLVSSLSFTARIEGQCLDMSSITTGLRGRAPKCSHLTRQKAALWKCYWSFGRTYWSSVKCFAMQTFFTLWYSHYSCCWGLYSFFSAIYYLSCYGYLDPNHYQYLLPIIVVSHFSNMTNSGNLRNANFK